MYPTVKSHTKSLLLGTTLIAGLAAVVVPTMAMAQDATETVIVTGYRKSLQESTEAKRNSNNFSDSIFAEDIGKFPDTNIAESFNRIPGITITREITGEGLNIAIRGLGTNFTKILLNGAQTAVASTGRTDSQNTNREVDLDMFPTELFTQLTVNKSPTADLVEGGAAGTVNMRSARPFDNEGAHLTYSFQGSKNSKADKWDPRGYLIASDTWGPFGFLVGISGMRNHVRTTGYETIGWTNPNLSAAQCSGTCNTTGGGNWTIPANVPTNVNAHGNVINPGTGLPLVPGAPITQALLLQLNPGASIQQIDNGLIPRLGRPSDEFGTKERYNGVASFEYRPSDDMQFYVDAIYGKRKNDLQRIDMNWVGRNGSAIPINTTYDRSDCSNGCVVTGGTYANGQFFLEYRPFIEQAEFASINPGMHWQIDDMLKMDLQANWSLSHFHRESPTVLVITPGNSGVTVNYSNTGIIPTATPNIDLNSPANFGWPGGRVNIQDESRLTITKGLHADFSYGGDVFAVKAGYAYDDVYRRIRAFDNSQAWQNAVCGDRPSQFLPGPNSQPPCNGDNFTATQVPGVPVAAGYPAYPGYGTGYSSGFPALTWGGSLVPQSQVANYLKPGPDGFITLDWDAFKAASNYDAFHNNAPEAGSSNTGASGGLVEEKTNGVYLEFVGASLVDDHKLRYNAGLRWVQTDQTIGGMVSITDPRNSVLPGSADGARYPNIVNFVKTNTTYHEWLPSFNAVFEVSDNVTLRGAISRTMTRANPNTMLPGLNFSSPSADTGTVGNPGLKPFLSDNIDIGGEYYTGGEGYFGVTAFRKTVRGFTSNGNVTVPFSSLAAYGVTYATLTPTQQAAIDSRGGPGVATVVLTQQVNASGLLYVNGMEFSWVQPLDFLLEDYGLKGFGFTSNLTLIDQKGTGAAPAIAVGVSPMTYNITGYYENDGASLRVSYVFNKGSQAATANQNGIAAAALYGDSYEQWDMSASYELSRLFDVPGAPEITFDMINITNSKQRSYFQFPSATFTYYDPGRQIMVGLRGRF